MNALSRPTRRAIAISALGCALAALSSCGAESLGDCQPNADELVYGRGDLVATKGQALMHDSCGKGAFCHSAGATGGARSGAPGQLSFDMLPNATGLDAVLRWREEIWDEVESGRMPPEHYALGDGDWRFDQRRRPGAQKLPAITSDEGKGVLRNWLACGAPVVSDSTVPEWVQPPSPQDQDSADSWEWSSLHTDLRTGCVDSGCHDASSERTPEPPGRLPLYAGECAVYRWLTARVNDCGSRLVIGGDPDGSLLLSVMAGEANDDEDCGLLREQLAAASGTTLLDEHPTAPRALLNDARAWVAEGAYAPQCGDWSDDALRVAIAADAGPPVAAGPPTWSEVYHDAIEDKGCVTCHSAEGAASAGGLDLSDSCVALEHLLGEKGACDQPRVVAGDADGSLLIDKLANDAPSCGKTRMPPPPFPKLSGAEIQLVRDWIDGGAPIDAAFQARCD